MSNSTLNNLQDVKNIVDSHYIKAGQFLEQGYEDVSQAQVAEDMFSDGLSKLKKLNLTPGDRKNIRLLRQSFEYAIKSCRALSRNKRYGSEQLMKKSAEFAGRYNNAVTARFKGV